MHAFIYHYLQITYCLSFHFSENDYSNAILIYVRFKCISMSITLSVIYVYNEIYHLIIKYIKVIINYIKFIYIYTIYKSHIYAYMYICIYIYIWRLLCDCIRSSPDWSFRVHKCFLVLQNMNIWWSNAI